MRQEVEKKIEVLKSQIIQLEAKLRLVRDSRTQESNLRNNRSNTSKSLG
jgi:prophage maintenance system killer protein